MIEDQQLQEQEQENDKLNQTQFLLQYDISKEEPKRVVGDEKEELPFIDLAANRSRKEKQRASVERSREEEKENIEGKRVQQSPTYNNDGYK